jgi:hypothetical protein
MRSGGIIPARQWYGHKGQFWTLNGSVLDSPDDEDASPYRATAAGDPRWVERHALYRQLYQNLRDAIVGRTLRPGTHRPASRLLAGDLRISRNTP